MSNIESQKAIDTAENKLSEAIKSLKPISKEAEPEVEVIAEATPDVDVVIETPKEPRRTEFVKTDDPKVQERINDLYRQVKGSDARNQAILEHNKLMEEKLAEYQEKLNKFEQENKNTAVNKIESDLKTQLRIAREENDYEAIESIEDRLLDLKLEKRLVEKIPVEKPELKPRVDPQKQQFEAQYLRNAAYLEVIAAEKDVTGKPLRGYLYDGHPDNDKALELFESIPKEFAAAGKQVDIKTIMDVMDERLRGKKNNAHTSVLSSESNNAPTKTTVRLTQAEINVARNMGISPERYARQKQLMT